jgi:hypothetical protein
MTFQHTRGRRCLSAAGLGTVIAVLAACGSSGHPAPSPTASSAPEPTNPAAAAPVIKANWVAFFGLVLPVSRRVALLQNGQMFATLVRAGSAEKISVTATARVTRVSVVTPTRAEVTYTVLISGHPVLSNQLGTSVYQNGVWKVSDSSYCALLTLQNGGNSSQLPAACKATG